MTIQDKLVTANFQFMKADIHIQTMTAEADQLRARIAELEAAHAMQDESLVVLPRHMVNSIEEKMKEQASQIELQGAEIRRLRSVIISYQEGKQ